MMVDIGPPIMQGLGQDLDNNEQVKLAKTIED